MPTRTRSKKPLVRQHVPLAAQDSSDLAARLEAAGISAAEAAVVDLGDAIAQATAALESQIVQTEDLDLRHGGQGGSLCVWRAFTDAQVGAPVLMVQAADAGSDAAEFGIVLLVAEVLDRRRMRVRWFCQSGAPARVKVAYIVGTADN